MKEARHKSSNLYYNTDSRARLDTFVAVQYVWCEYKQAHTMYV